jgi:hypothetical protein
MTAAERIRLYDARRERLLNLTERVRREAQVCANGEWNNPMLDLVEAVEILGELIHDGVHP